MHYILKVFLLYYTGTYNTRYLSNRIADGFRGEGDEVVLYEINPQQPERLDFSSYDIVGLGYPIYGFAAPWPFLKFIRYQRFPKGLRTFIYKNSGETYHDNDASSKFVLRKLRRSRVIIENEYHFGMPYNIHFKYEDKFVREQLYMNDKLMRILIYELKHHIPNLRPYSFRSHVITGSVARWQYIGGDVNSFFYKVDKDKCIHCDKCVKNCPTHNIYHDDKDGTLRFHHNCLMCMRCSMNCPTDAIYIGFLDAWGWRVNGAYDWGKIEKMPYEPVITTQTKGFFECYIESFQRINQRYAELFEGAEPKSEIPYKRKVTGIVSKLLRSAIHKTDIHNE